MNCNTGKPWVRCLQPSAKVKELNKTTQNGKVFADHFTIRAFIDLINFLS